ncbi:maleylacetoacetate isomerase [Duganella sp. FT50W]|uniref:Maleylacetoacetate isomerase n=1 Tax=Duganella lactea TaxID=2692173 RepID=A0A6L8MPR2_9BURK|nr:maleylacetoacetate isomerase [Duganella lactea]MYM82905.1 maleylacetoacetate isomerase [Duganella lactea]
MKLYTYFRSSAAYRVRIALALKGIAYDAAPVHLLRNGGEQLGDAYRAINPAGLVPALEVDGNVIGQSLAIIEYLEETYPQPPLLPATPMQRARVRALALTVAADTHPLGNLRVLKHLTGPLGVTEEVKLGWQQHWLRTGLSALESLLADDSRTGCYSHGDTPTLADCCLVPQVFGAQRFGIDMAPYPAIMRIHAACAELPAFQQAHPSQQPDAE